MKAVLITGVSSGIGLEAARQAVARGFQVFGSVRRKEDAPELGENFYPLLFDVTDRAALREARAEVERQLGGKKLSGLVNNAGIAVPGPLMELPEEDLRRQMEVNFFAPIACTREFLPLLGKGARIVMVSSVSGKVGYPFLGAYAASKHALEGASASLRRELLFHGMDVVLLCPGAIRTPIWQKASLAAFARGAYGAVLPKVEREMEGMARRGLPVEEMGELIGEILADPRPRVRYTPVPSKFLRWTLPRLLPELWLDRIVLRTLR